MLFNEKWGRLRHSHPLQRKIGLFTVSLERRIPLGNVGWQFCLTKCLVLELLLAFRAQDPETYNSPDGSTHLTIV